MEKRPLSAKTRVQKRNPVSVNKKQRTGKGKPVKPVDTVGHFYAPEHFHLAVDEALPETKGYRYEVPPYNDNFTAPESGRGCGEHIAGSVCSHFDKNPTGADTKGVCTRIGVIEVPKEGSFNAVPSCINTETTDCPPVEGEAVETRSIPSDL